MPEKLPLVALEPVAIPQLTEFLDQVSILQTNQIFATVSRANEEASRAQAQKVEEKTAGPFTPADSGPQVSLAGLAQR